MVTFDVFPKNDIEKVNAKINETFDIEPTIKKSAFFGGSVETKNFIWKIESLPKLFETLKAVCEERKWDYNFEFLPKYIEGFQVLGYDSPNFPFYVIMAKITLKKDAINSAKDLRKDIFQIAIPARLFIETLKGFQKTFSTFSPNAPLVTQFWVKISKKDFTTMREMELSLIGEDDKLSLVQKKEQGKQLRSLEQINIASPTGDVHSHILFASNLSYVIGHLTQVGLGGLFSPYLLYLSYDEKLLQQKLQKMYLPPAEILIRQGIVTQEYAHLIGLISLSIYLSKLASEGEKIDQEASKLRDVIIQKNSQKSLDQQLSEINEMGTNISSLQQTIGRFSRYWEGSIHGISEGKNRLYDEIPIKSDDVFGQADFAKKGYLGTLADQILRKMDGINERLEKQGLEIASLRTHISDIVNLKSIKANESLQRSMKWMTWVMLIFAAVTTTLSIIQYGSLIDGIKKIFSESQLLNLRLFGVSLIEVVIIGLIVVFPCLILYYIYRWFNRKQFLDALIDFFWRKKTIPKSMKKSNELKNQRKIFSELKSWAPLIISILWIVSIVGVYFLSFNSGQIFVAKLVRHNVEVVDNLASAEVQSKLIEYFPQTLNYTELFTWESTRINFTQNREIHTDPLEILDYGKGACGEFSIVYVAACLANDIPARLVVTGYVIPGNVDHTWAEVNPSKDGKNWIHVEPTDCAYNILHGKDISELTSCFNNPSKYYDKGFELVLAYEPTYDGEVIIWDRTEFYSGAIENIE